MVETATLLTNGSDGRVCGHGRAGRTTGADPTAVPPVLPVATNVANAAESFVVVENVDAASPLTAPATRPLDNVRPARSRVAAARRLATDIADESSGASGHAARGAVSAPTEGRVACSGAIVEPATPPGGVDVESAGFERVAASLSAELVDDVRPCVDAEVEPPAGVRLIDEPSGRASTPRWLSEFALSPRPGSARCDAAPGAERVSASARASPPAVSPGMSPFSIRS